MRARLRTVSDVRDKVIDHRIGQRIIAMRYVRGMSQKELAEKVGRWPSTILRIERGLSLPPPATLQAIAHALDADASDLLPDEEVA